MDARNGAVHVPRLRSGRWAIGVFAVLAVVLASSGLAQASYEAGMHAFVTGKFGEALKNFEPMVAQHHSPSQTALGLMYLNGLGVPKDPMRAADLFTQAATSGNAAAAHYLGSLYRRGVGVPQCLDLAYRWILQSAQSGYPEAEVNLGVLYEQGLGVAADDEQAAHWYNRAAVRGLGDGLYRLALLYDAGRGVEQDATKAAALFERASARSNAQARTALGRKYYVGDGVPQDLVVAYMYLTLGAGLGDNSGTELLNQIELELAPSRLDEARRLARSWRPF